jgi:formylmethanofuran dehydrogenase subunit E
MSMNPNSRVRLCPNCNSYHDASLRCRPMSDLEFAVRTQLGCQRCGDSDYGPWLLDDEGKLICEPCANVTPGPDSLGPEPEVAP